MNARNGVAAASLVIVTVLLALAGGGTAPGALAKVHARADLSGANACAQCHAESDRSMADACMAGDAEVRGEVVDHEGLHGQLAPELARNCAHCHGEHEGAGLQLAGTPAFVRAGYASADAYDHAGLDFKLVGAHARLQCERCHAQARLAELPPNTSRFLGLDQSCATCHGDPHKGSYGADCASCHGQSRPFPAVDGFDHETFCPLVGSHGKVACTRCHQEDSHWSVAALSQRHAVDGGLSGDKRDCIACHVSPHRETFVDDVVAAARAAGGAGAASTASAASVASSTSMAGTAGVAGRAGRPGPGAERSAEHPHDEAGCRLCHSSAHESFLGEHAEMDRAWHAASGFALDAPHAGLRCEQCHPGIGTRPAMSGTTVVAATPDGPALRDGGDRSAFLADYPGRRADDCQACHRDPHEGQFAQGPFAAANCLSCHDRHAFAPSSFDAEDHSATHFALDGHHAEARCEDCHLLPDGDAGDTPEGRALRRFAGVDSGCGACHASPHRETFLAEVAQRLHLDGDAATCAQCHDAHDLFAGQHGDVVRQVHAASGFALDAPHDKVECSRCHEGFGSPKLAADMSTRPPGAARSAVRGAARDARGGAGGLAAPAVPRLDAGAGGSGLRASDGAPLRAFAAAYPGRNADDCAACHEDPHEGQFERGAFAVQSCLACHDRHAFVPAAFGDTHHGRTKFPLTGSHLAVGCSSCHVKPGEQITDSAASPPSVAAAATGGATGGVTGGATGGVRRFTGTPTDCASCHGDVHDGGFDGPGHPPVINGATGCARCHTTRSFGDFAVGSFDHALWTGYALEGAHAGVACAGCHVPSRTPDAHGRTFGKAPGSNCSDCHAAGTVRLDGAPEGRR